MSKVKIWVKITSQAYLCVFLASRAETGVPLGRALLMFPPPLLPTVVSLSPLPLRPPFGFFLFFLAWMASTTIEIRKIQTHCWIYLFVLFYLFYWNGSDLSQRKFLKLTPSINVSLGTHFEYWYFWRIVVLKPVLELFFEFCW